MIKEKKVKLSPSIIATDYKNPDTLNLALEFLKSNKVAILHLDVMDGKFVKNKTFDASFVRKMREKTDFILDTHLMVKNPEDVIEDYIEAGADILTVHYEATKNLENVLKQIKKKGVLAGVSIKPETDPTVLKSVLDKNLVDVVLVMSVEPGACGQTFNQGSIEKIKKIRKMNDKVDIEVDGGINDLTAPMVVKAGANIIVSGSAIFGASDPKSAIIHLMNLKR